MDVVLLARLQFAIVTIYHFFFVPLTLGLSVLIAIMETIYVRSGDETYKKMTKFWGKLFLASRFAANRRVWHLSGSALKNGQSRSGRYSPG